MVTAVKHKMAESSDKRKFDGTTDVYEFVQNFRLHAIDKKLNEAEQITRLQLKLAGHASRRFKRWDDGVKASIVGCLDKLVEEFKLPSESYYKQFQELEYDDEIGPKSFAYQLEELLERAFPNDDPTKHDTMLTSQFIIRLPTCLKETARTNAKDGWYKMINAVQASVHDKVESKVKSTKEEAFDLELNKLYSNNWKNKSNVRFDGNCYNCGKRGHRASECRQSKKQGSVDAVKKNNNKLLNHITLRMNSTWLEADKRSAIGHTQADNMFRIKIDVAVTNSSIKSKQFLAMVDSGASHSFINPKRLSEEMKAILRERLNSDQPEKFGMETAECTVNMVKTREKTEVICIPFAIRVGDWTGVHNFIISDLLKTEEAIIGQDFLTTNDAVIISKERKLVFDGSKALVANALKVEEAKLVNQVGAVEGNSVAEWRMTNEKTETNGELDVASGGFELFDVAEMLEDDDKKCENSKTKLAESEVKREVVQIVEDKTMSKITAFDTNNVVEEASSNHDSRADAKLKNNVNCRVSRDHVILPRHEAVVRLKTNLKGHDRPVFFERNEKLRNGALVARSVNNLSKDGSLVVSVVNTNKRPIRLKKNVIIGSINALDEEDIMNGDEEKEMLIEEDELNLAKRIDSLKFGELNERQSEQVRNLLKKYSSVFNWNEGESSTTNVAEHKIDVGDARPIKRKQYRIPQNLKKEVKNQVDSMLDKGIIRPSMSPWNAPVLLVKKKNGKFRFCVDFRDLNEVTVKDSYPLPYTDEAIESLSGAKYFSTLDFANGYWQIPLEDGSKEKTAFTVDNETYEFNVMPFGLTNAPSTFQRMMNGLLKGLTWRRCLVYLDDVIIFARSFDELLVNLEEVLKRIKEANLKLQPEKCVFGAKKVRYLGFELSDKGIFPDTEKIRIVDELKSPRNTKELKRFIGSISFYRRFIKDFSKTAACLYELTSPKTKFIWTETHETAFNKLKESLKVAPILKYPDYSRNFIIETDASNHAIGAVLIQEFDGVPHPIAYASRHLTKAEKNYSTSEKELLAVVWSAKHFHYYICNRKILFFTDHKPLVTLKKLKDRSSRIGKMFFKLQNINYDIHYKKGEENVMADFLSRIPENELNIATITKIEPSLDWSSEQNKDEVLSAIKQLLVDNNNSRHDWRLHVDNLSWFKIRKWLRLSDKILFKLGFKNEFLIVVPKHLRKNIFELYHDMNNHSRSYEKIKEKFFWLNLEDEIIELSNSCLVCQKTKKPNQRVRAPLKPIVVTRPFQLLGIDAIVGLPKSKYGNVCIILLIDYFTKWIEAQAFKNFNALTTAKFIFEVIFCRFGIPEGLISDQGTNFMASLVGELCKLCGVKKLNTTSYHHEGVGMVERSIRTIKSIIRCYINETHTNYDELLNQVVFTYNTTIHSSSKFTPYEALFARKPVSLQDVILNVSRNPTYSNRDEYVRSIIENSKRIQTIINKHLERSRKNQKKQYDKLVSDFKPYEKDDLVLLTKEAGKPGLSKKFLDKYVGPFKVLRRINDLNYEICLIENEHKSKVVHYNRLKTFHERKATNNLRVVRKGSTKANYIVEQCSSTGSESDSEVDSINLPCQINFDTSDELVDEAIDLITTKVLDELIECELRVEEENGVGVGDGDDADGVSDVEEVEEGETIKAKPLQCPKCSKAYIYEKSFNKHMKKCN